MFLVLAIVIVWSCNHSLNHCCIYISSRSHNHNSIIFKLKGVCLQTALETLELCSKLPTKTLRNVNEVALMFLIRYFSIFTVKLELELELELITDDDMLLMIEKGMRGGICHAILGMQKQIISI